MSTPPLANTFNGGTNGVALTDTPNNTGGGSGDAFDAVSGASCTFSSTQSHSGGISMALVNPSAGSFVRWSNLGTITTDVYFRWYMYMNALPPDNNFYPLRIGSQTDVNSGIIRVLADGSVNTRDASNSQANFFIGPVATAQWVRMEARIVSSTTVGQIDCRLYNSADSTSITDSCTSTNQVLAANTGTASFGLNTATPVGSFTVYFDDLAVSTTGWIGPTSSGILGPTSWLGAIG